jgi:hypothetical protein
MICRIHLPPWCVTGTQFVLLLFSFLGNLITRFLWTTATNTTTFDFPTISQHTSQMNSYINSKPPSCGKCSDPWKCLRDNPCRVMNISNPWFAQCVALAIIVVLCVFGVDRGDLLLWFLWWKCKYYILAWIISLFLLGNVKLYVPIDSTLHLL